MKILERSLGRAKPRIHGVRVGSHVLRDLAQSPSLELRKDEQRSLAFVELTEQLLEQANPLRGLGITFVDAQLRAGMKFCGGQRVGNGANEPLGWLRHAEFPSLV